MMIFLKLLLSSGIIFIAVTAFIRNKSLCYRPSEYMKPMHYDIKLTSYIEANIFYGEYNISINIFKKVKNIYLHSEKLCIKNIVLITNLKKYENDKNTIYKPTYTTEKDPTYNTEEEKKIKISFLDELSPGNYTLNIKCFGFAHKGFRIFNMKNKIVWIGGPHFQIIDAQKVFPCRHSHDLLLGATFNISLRCPNCTTFSNMPVQNTERTKYNLEWKHYNTTPAMLTHHVTMVMSHYLYPLGIKTQNIEMWYRIKSEFHMEFAKNVAENITLHFEHIWKRSDKIWNVNHVVIPNFLDKDITVLGLVFYRDTDLIYDKNLYPIAHKIEVTQLVGRKVTQEWFNNMINNPLVSDFWFKKGLITLLATYAINKTYPDYRIINLFVVQNQHYSLNLDGAYYMWNLLVDSLLGIPNYIKAPFILRMMQHVLTEEIFQKGIRRYVYLNIHYIGFVEHMRQTALRINPLVDIGDMDNWASEKHCPIIKIERNYTNPISQICIQIQYLDLLKIRCIPVTFTTQAFPDFNNFTHHLLCQPVSKSQDFELSLSFKENGWIIFNIQQIGYYRVNYDDKNWQRIINYLQSNNYKKIHVLNRAQIIDDAFHLMIADHINASIFLNIMPYLSEEEDYIAWYPMFKALEYMFGTFPVAMLEEIVKDFTNRAWFILAGVLQKIKYKEIDDTDELRNCLRQEAAKWACFLDDITCKEEANKKLKQHLQDPTKHKLLPWWKEWTYCKGLMITTKNETTWELMHTKGLEKSDLKFFEYLACPQDINLIKKYLDDMRYKQYNSTEQKYQYHLNGFLHIITKHAKNQIILEYILDHFNERPKNVHLIAALIIIINNVYSGNLIQQISISIGNFIDINLVEINNTEDLFRRHQIKEISDTAIDKGYLYNKFERKITIRYYQIEEQIRHLNSLFH